MPFEDSHFHLRNIQNQVLDLLFRVHDKISQPLHLVKSVKGYTTPHQEKEEGIFFQSAGGIF